MNYEFNADEGFTFDGKHTSEFNLILLERVADPPPEKVIKENIPFMQGDLDFSAILGQRVFNNRSLQYRMLIVDYSYERRKIIEKSLTNWLMKPAHIKLYDDFSRNYYYLAKCESISYVDRYEGMTAVITFDAYPFMIGKYEEGNDIWDIFNFELDVAQITEFEVAGSETVTLYNPGSNIVFPKFITSAPLEIVKDGISFIIPEGESESTEFILKVGENELTILGTGTVKFQFFKELL